MPPRPTSSHPTGIEKQTNGTLEVLDTSDLIESQTVSMRNLEVQSTLTENQIVTKTDERDLTAPLTDSVAAIAVLESLVQNSSAEEVVNKASKWFSLTTEIDSQLNGCEHQTLPDLTDLISNRMSVCPSVRMGSCLPPRVRQLQSFARRCCLWRSL